ncbi:MAG: hypothetical protein ACLGG5_04940, partial [Thermoleophilia bacterium]
MGTSTRRGRRRTVVLLTAAFCAMALSAGTATAAPLHPFLETFGSAAQPSFSSPQGVAIYQASGDVYVMDNGSSPSIK